MSMIERIEPNISFLPPISVSPPVDERYSPELAAYLLANPGLTQLSWSDRLPGVDFFNRTVLTGDRIAVEMDPSERVYIL